MSGTQLRVGRGRLRAMRLDRARGTLALIAVAMLSGCGPLGLQFGEQPLDPEGARRGPMPGVAPGGPPPVIVRTEAHEHVLEPWTYCFGNGCADGAPPANPPDVGSPDRVEVEFPLPGWSFEAEFVPAGDACPRRQTVPLESTGDGTWLVEPAGPAGTYDVTLFGRGDGDLFVTFRWTTPADGPMPEPQARLAVLADHDGAVDSYGIELELSNLATDPQEASAEVTVTASEGESLTFSPTRAPGCMAEGTVYWDGPDPAGLEAAALGSRPFTYTVVVTLDGIEHTASAAWPADEMPDYAPSVPLVFEPPLPGLR